MLFASDSISLALVHCIIRYYKVFDDIFCNILQYKDTENFSAFTLILKETKTGILLPLLDVAMEILPWTGHCTGFPNPSSIYIEKWCDKASSPFSITILHSIAVPFSYYYTTWKVYFTVFDAGSAFVNFPCYLVPRINKTSTIIPLGSFNYYRNIHYSVIWFVIKIKEKSCDLNNLPTFGPLNLLRTLQYRNKIWALM